MKKNVPQVYQTVVLGSGPAGIGPLICALQQGRLTELLDRGIAFLDRGNAMGRGTIGQYIINSDTLGGTLLECLQGPGEEAFATVLGAAPTQLIEQRRAGAVPLPVVGEYMALLGRSIRVIVDQHPVSQFYTHTEARAVRRLSDGLLEVETLVYHDSGRIELQLFLSRSVVFAMGASQNRAQTLAEELVPGINLKPYEQKVMLTGSVLTAAGVEAIEQRLAEKSAKKVLIIGGSHSAFSSAWTLLNKTQGLNFSDGDITILHRNPLKLFYPSREAALSEGYTDFTDDDFCPVTQRLYRLAGFRLDSRELLMRIWGMRPESPEQRVRLQRLDPQHDDPQAIRALLEEAELIIPAFGYRPNVVPIYEADGAPVALLAQQRGALPLVDTAGCVLDTEGQPIPNIYGIGLASGFKLTGKLGGEPSFKGQTNGLWLYQNGVGEIILNHMLAN